MKPTTQDNYIILQTVYYKTPKLYAAIRKEQACEMHPALFDTPVLRKLGRAERMVWLLLDGKRNIEDLQRLTGFSRFVLEDILDFLEVEGLIKSAVTSKPARPIFSSWPYTDWLTRLSLTSTSFWRYFFTGAKFYPYLKGA